MRRLLLELTFNGVAFPVAHFVAFEVCDLANRMGSIRPVARFGHWAFVAMVGMEVVVHVTPEVRRTMKPGSGADEYAP